MTTVTPAPDPESAAAAGTTEAGECAECARDAGLCAYHAAKIGAVRPPSWVKDIGDSYVCLRAECRDHERCLDVPNAAAPRVGCECHACGQARQLKRARQGAAPEPTAAERKVARRHAARVERQAKRIGTLVAGGFAPARRRRAA